MTTIREDIANQMGEENFVNKVSHYCDLIKTNKHFPIPFTDTSLVRILQDLYTTATDEAYADGYNEALFIKSVKKKAHHAD